MSIKIMGFEWPEEVSPMLCSYLADYINEEISRGASIDKYTMSEALEAFTGGAYETEETEEA
jgi:hypothetical protein